MAATNNKGALPEGFEMPFHVVPQASRHDCGLAAVATLTGKTLEEVWAAAVKFGLPKIGQYYVSEELLAKLLMQMGGLVSSSWREFTSFDALPGAVSLLWVDAQEDDPDNTGRIVIFHHVREVPGKYSSFSYILDGYWPEPERQVVTDIKRFSPTAFIEIKPKGGSKPK